MKKLLFLFSLFVITLKGEYPGQKGVIYYDPTNYWNMEAGSLITKILHSDSMRAWHGYFRKGDIDTMHSNYLLSKITNAKGLKYGVGIKGGVLTFLFIDGYKSCLDTFAPLLANYNVKGVAAIIAAIPNHVNSESDTFMSWNELDALVDNYDWEIACRGYDYTIGHSDYWASWFNMEKAKEVIEDSLGMKIVSFASPPGTINGWDDYFLRKNYWCSTIDSTGYNNFDDLDLYRLKIYTDVVDLQTVADSGYWVIKVFSTFCGESGKSTGISISSGYTNSTEEIESLVVKARRLGIEILTFREVIEKYNLLNTSPLRIVWDINTDYSFQRLTTWDGTNDILDSDTSKMEVWSFNPLKLLGWMLSNFTSYSAETLKSNVPIGAADQTIPTPTTLYLESDVGDTVILRRFFVISDSIPVAYLSFYTVPRNAFSPFGWAAWVLNDTTDDKYWDNDKKEWVDVTIYNQWDNSIDSSCKRIGTYIYNVRPHGYSFSFYYRKDSTDANLYFDDLSLVPSATGNVKVKIIFDKVNFYDTEINSSIDMLFENGVGPILTSPSGYKYRLIIDDSGNLTTQKIIE